MMSWIRVTVFKVFVMFLATRVTDSTDTDGVMMQNSLTISIYDISLNFVEIDWNYKDSKHSQIISCELIYGPVSDPAQVQVYTGIIIVPDEHIFKLNGLENNVTYQLRMTCHNDKGHNFHSNALRFTTGSKSFPMNYVFRGHSSLARDSFYSRDDDHARTVRSSNVILGAVCGIVGFLIINVTIVMVVRKYSHRQMHRRRIMEIEERDYDDFPYLRGYE